MKPCDCRVLIVDDEEDLLELMEDSFELENFKVFVAKNGAEAIEVLKEKEIDIVISDENMPAVSGYDVLRHITGNGYPESLRFYFSTGNIDANETQMIEDGASGLIMKPFDTDDVINKIKDEIKNL